MKDTDVLALIRKTLSTWETNAAAENGDTHLSDPMYCRARITEIAQGDIGKAEREGWI